MTTTVICKETQQKHDIDLTSNGENYLPCPSCSPDRKKSKDKCLKFNAQKGLGKCYHCESAFYNYTEPEAKEVVYTMPEWKNFTDLDAKSAKWFEGRMIGQNVIKSMNVSNKSVWMPQTKKEENCVCFPFYKNGEIVNIKYRDGSKNFKLEKGAERCWYNYDAISENEEIVIVEGEMDALSFIQEGILNVTSPPNGAKSVLESLDLEAFDHVKKIYLALDKDQDGKKATDSLLEAFGSERCLVCSFEDKKDANEYLMAKGYNSLRATLENAVYIRSKAVIRLDNLLDRSRLNPQEVIEKPPVILSIVEKFQGGNARLTPIFSLGDFSMLQGKQKSKKTFLISAIITAMLNPNVHSKLEADIPTGRERVAIFDTEQSKYYGQKTNTRIYRSAQNINYDYFSLRTLPPEDRKALVERYLQRTPDCSFFVIDGIVDLLNDFNDLKESKELVQWLMTITEKHNSHALSILHENIGDGQKARGHLGTFLSQKAETIIRAEKKVGEDATSTIEAKGTRGREFRAFDLKINENGEPYFDNLVLPQSINPLVNMSHDNKPNLLQL